MVDFWPMKISALMSCALYLLAGVALSATQLCVDPQGNSVYEFTDDGCCGGEACVSVQDAGTPQDEPLFVAAPKCGGCTITKMPLPCAPVAEVASAISEPGEPAVLTADACATLTYVPSTPLVVPRMSLQLRI